MTEDSVPESTALPGEEASQEKKSNEQPAERSPTTESTAARDNETSQGNRPSEQPAAEIQATESTAPRGEKTSQQQKSSEQPPAGTQNREPAGEQNGPPFRIIPATVELASLDTQKFAVEPEMPGSTWELNPPEDSGVSGSVDKIGNYVAPKVIARTRSILVIAHTPDRKRSATATVTLSDTPRRIAALGWYGVGIAILLGLALMLLWGQICLPGPVPLVVVNPSVVTLDLQQKEDFTFTATVLGDMKNGVTWAATGGRAIDSNGVYRHEKQDNVKDTTITVTATSVADPKRFGTATLYLKNGQHFEVLPQGATAFTSKQISFRTQRDRAAGWSLSGRGTGTLAADGTYSAPAGIREMEPVQVVAWNEAGGLAAATLILIPQFADRCANGWPVLLLVIAMGALGSMIHYTSSFVGYVGNRKFQSSWFWFYISRPFVGGALAVIFFLLAGSKLVGAETTTDVMTTMAIAAIVGLFSDKAVLKLSNIFDAILSPKDDREDTLKASKSNPKPEEKAAAVGEKKDKKQKDGAAT